MQIALSQLKAHGFADEAAFKAAVATHIAALIAHQTTVGEPLPVAPSVVEHAIRRNQYPHEAQRADEFVAAVEVIDDTPPPPSLDQRKMELAAKVGAVAMAALHAITPPLKARSLALQVNAAKGVDENKRTAAQRKLIADADNRGRCEQAVHRHWAELESQIHDLTEATIEQWSPAPFPE